MINRFLTALLFVTISGISTCAYCQEKPLGNVYQTEELGLFQAPEDPAAALETIDQPSTMQSVLPRDSGTVLAPDFINFGYIQNNTILPYLHWESLTHVATTFINFDANGNLTNPSSFTNRNSALKAGGAADRAGTKVIVCVRNNAFDETILASVMQNAARRTQLVTAVKNLVLNDGYCQGVNFDFEFDWGTATRDGITLFMQEMRTALPSHEISVYTHAILDSNQWNIGAIEPYIDYLLYSTYDWATGNTVRAPGAFDNCLPYIRNYFNAGLPPEKMVLTWTTYGRRWAGVSSYGATGSSPVSHGFYDGLYDSTLRQTNGGPLTSNYERGDEVGWIPFNQSGTNYTMVWESPEAMEYKIRAALNFPGYNGSYEGVRLGGVGWWSLMWLSNYHGDFESWNPITNSIVSRPPHYKHMYLLVQEILKSPGQQNFLMESFEGDNPHWRDPNESPDTAGDTDGDSSLSYLNVAGTPTGTSRVARLVFDFEAASGNKAFLRYEILNNPIETAVVDVNAALARVAKNTRFTGRYYVAGNYTGRQLRLALMDGQREVEVSDPILLPATAGWYSFAWDINSPSQINGWNTNEPALRDGDSIVETAGAGARDISFLGFIVEGGGAGVGTMYFDDLRYEPVAPDGKQYVINEFRYSTNTSEFVEIHGPAGPFPSDMVLRCYDSSDGSVFKSTSLAGKSIPASGVYVIGDSGVPGASGTSGFTPANWSSGDDIRNGAPSALQLYGTSNGYTYDSAVYGAFGGIKDLSRQQTQGVSDEGYGWIGNVATGLAGSNQPYSMGRMPDGADTNVNQDDFSFMPPTPGQPNGASGIINNLLTFSSAVPAAFQTYASMIFTNPTSNGLPASPSGGAAYRCYDPAGGGVIGVFGDGQLGNGTGTEVTGKLYIPAAGHPTQAVAVGFCSAQGSTFFTGSPNGSGYEDGYWLIYEHGTVNLNDGLTNHAGQFEFIAASNDNEDAVPAVALGARKSLAQLGTAANTWVDFKLRIDPSATPGEQLTAQINGQDVYRGPIPANGRLKGAFVVGHRETGGGVAASEGTWVDDVLIKPANESSGISEYMLYN